MKLLYSKKLNRNYVWDEKGDFHCDKGHIKKDVLLSAKIGDMVKTNMDFEFRILEQTFMDKYRKIKRLAQIITPKDAAHIISIVGNDYKRVLDCGSGSGALSIFLAKLNPKAKIYSMDNREDHKNVEIFELKNVEFIFGDIYEGIPKSKLDLVTLDVPEPNKVVPFLKKSLNHGAFVVSYSPCTNQVLEFVNALDDDFIIVKSVEIMERYWDVGGRVIRPSTLGPQHTGFLTFARYL
jgi:tRNA (adenine57-N1/adenine58-N1)-methyltransferase catalytic subunit